MLKCLIATFLEFVAVFDEAEFLVERHRVALRVHFQFAIAERARLFDQQIEDRLADPAAAPVGQHGHATDLAFGRQPTGADGIASVVAREHVARNGVEVVPFVLARHVLADDENLFAYRAAGVAFGLVVPVDGGDGEVGGDHG